MVSNGPVDGTGGHAEKDVTNSQLRKKLRLWVMFIFKLKKMSENGRQREFMAMNM